MLISAFAPWAIIPLLMLGGLFLCFEGVEKLVHPLLHAQEETKVHHQALVGALANPQVDMVAFELPKRQRILVCTFKKHSFLFPPALP